MLRPFFSLQYVYKTNHLQKFNRIRSKSTFFLFFMQCRHFASGTHTQFLFTYRFYSLDTSVRLQEVYVYIYVRVYTCILCVVTHHSYLETTWTGRGQVYTHIQHNRGISLSRIHSPSGRIYNQHTVLFCYRPQD